MTLALAVSLCLGLMQFAFAQEQVATTTEPEPRDMTEDFKDHSVHIEFCMSWGSKQNFLQVRTWLERTFPELRGRVTGGEAPIPPIVELLFNILSMLQFAGILFVIMGDNVFRLIGMQRGPNWYYDIFMKNPVPIMIGLYIMIPSILNGYMISGAFEIILDGNEKIFSKLATGRMPQADDLITPLTEAGLQYIKIE